MSPRTAARTDSRLAVRLAALASLGASVIHFAVVPAHWHEWAPAGLFFVVIGLTQLTWALWVLARTTPSVLAAGIMLNVGAIALWTVSRTTGAPFGPHSGTAEVVAGADLCAVLLQTYVVMGAGWVVYRGLRGASIPAFANAMVLVGAVGVVTLASTVGVASGLRHDHHGPTGSPGGHHGPGIEHTDAQHGQVRQPAAPVPVVAPVGTPAPAQQSAHDHDHAH
ncbi:hypothetical protein [Mycobacterium sp. SMC-4]|uniref:hypothetical protein n=1 Tax=Mycobacterium sp. SMC-4 TaxID=2857059 RepID=UPI0021B2242C|nr:hypothetical protein [Mycobacterium sp. SMC-4]UXA18050.1 hypothetical protein KXD98_25855 [Mycobacterium sp. SMC-4]